VIVTQNFSRAKKSVSPHFQFFVLSLALLASFIPTARAVDTCFGSGDAMIAACGRMIASDKLVTRDLSIVHNNRGDAYRNKGEYDRAIADFDEAIRLNPKFAIAYYNRGNSHWHKGEYDRAIADFDEAIRLDPKMDDAYQNRANTWKYKGDLDNAMTDLNAAIRINPKNALAYSTRGEIWRLKGDLDRALSDLDQAIRYRQDPLFLCRRGETWRYRGDLDHAFADFDKAIHIYPDFALAYAGRGLTWEKKGNLAQARSDFDRALAIPEFKFDTNPEAQATSRARLSALDSGAEQPSIPAVPAKAGSQTSIPTPIVSIPALLPATAQPSAAKQGRRVALVIGNAAYKNVSELANPHNDAEAIARSLRNIGFDSVSLVDDATREKLVDSLRVFAGEADTADWAMVYYAGHGIELSGQNYLIPVDAKLAADRDVQFEAVPLGQVLAALEGAKKLKIVLLDACRVNPFMQQMQRTEAAAAIAVDLSSGGKTGTRSIGRGLARVEVQTGPTLVVFAAKDGQTALDGDGPDSPFAIAMVQRIATPGVEINKIFRLVRDDVMEATAGRQEPYTYGSLPGREDFFFVPAK
jgi:tetratricopeptide (TPR) repeat protein